MKKYVVLLLCLLIALCMVAAQTAFAEEQVGVARLPIDLTPLFQALIAACAAVVTGKLIPWIKARTTADQQTALGIMTRTLVFAAEQIFKNEKKSGNKKLMYVKSKLLERGYDIDLDAIEAAVTELGMGAPIVIETAVGVEATEEDEPPDDPDNPE